MILKATIVSAARQRGRVRGVLSAKELQTKREGMMSDKDRQKKDGRDKNKKNQEMRETNENPGQKRDKSAQQQAKAKSNLTNTETGRAGAK